MQIHFNGTNFINAVRMFGLTRGLTIVGEIEMKGDADSVANSAF